MFPDFKDKNFENFLNDKITDYSQIEKFAGKRDITQGKTLDELMERTKEAINLYLKCKKVDLGDTKFFALQRIEI